MVLNLLSSSLHHMSLSGGLFESLQIWPLAFPRVSDLRERQRAKRKPQFFLCTSLGNGITTYLSYSVGHTDHPETMWKKTTPEHEYQGLGIIGVVILEASYYTASSLFFFFNYNFPLLLLKQPGHLSDRVCVFIISSQWCHLHISLPIPHPIYFL